MDVEQATYDVTLLHGQLTQLDGRQQHAWRRTLQRLRRERADQQQQRRQLAERRKQYVITAPVDGHLTQTGGLQPGAFATAGQALAQVVPHGRIAGKPT